MKFKYKIILTFMLIYISCTGQVFASRPYPEIIPPIVYNDRKIVAENNSPDNMGIVQAFDVESNKLLWSTTVYKVKIKPFIEEDTQWIFIKEMKIDNDKLIIINEKGDKYTLDPSTGESLDKSNSTVFIIVSISIILCILYIVIKKKILLKG